MWAWLKMSMTMWVVVVTMMLMVGQGSTHPTKLMNDRPIIGILAQEVYGPLREAVIEILYNNDPLIVGLDQGINVDIFEKHHYNEETRPDLPGEEEQQDQQNTPEEDSSENTRKESSVNSSPTDGVPTTTPRPSPIPQNASYIGASYVKFIEAAGARVVPIFINQERTYYKRILGSLNGVLFPGGSVAIDETSAFGRAGKIIYELAKEMNDRGEVFPIWGTCLGFEMLMGLAAEGREIRTRCDAQNTANPIKLDPGFVNGYLLRHLPKKLLKALSTKPLTGNFHMYCITPKNFTKFGIDRTYRPLGYSADRRGVEYVAAVEARDYPFFGVQFHPEKSPFEWTTQPGHNLIPHSSDAIDIANYFAQVFVNYARRSKHVFKDPAEEADSLIYNYPPVYTGQNSFMEQMYIF